MTVAKTKGTQTVTLQADANLCENILSSWKTERELSAASATRCSARRVRRTRGKANPFPFRQTRGLVLLFASPGYFFSPFEKTIRSRWDNNYARLLAFISYLESKESSTGRNVSFLRVLGLASVNRPIIGNYYGHRPFFHRPSFTNTFPFQGSNLSQSPDRLSFGVPLNPLR